MTAIISLVIALVIRVASAFVTRVPPFLRLLNLSFRAPVFCNCEKGHSGFTYVVTSWLTTAMPNFTVRLLTQVGHLRPLRMVYKDRFVRPIISSSPNSGSLIECLLTVEYISSGSAFKMIVAKRSSVTASPKSLSSSRS